MTRIAMLATLFSAVLVIVLPFTGGSGPSIASAMSVPASAVSAAITTSAVSPASVATGVTTTTVAAAVAADSAHLTVDTEHAAQKPLPKPKAKPKASAKASTSGAKATATSSKTAATTTTAKKSTAKPAAKKCPSNVGGSTAGAPGRTSSGGVGGTTSADLNAFAAKYNAVRVAHCLAPVPMSHIRYDKCMEDRLFWMAEDPSTDPASAWGHMGSKRSDGVPSKGCDGNLAGGSGNTGATVAQKWWDSSAHRASLYRPTYTGSLSGVCIGFAMTHGGVPNEPSSFTRAAARWIGC